MVIKPKTRGFICTTAHPVGCGANVQAAVNYAKAHAGKGPKRVLVVGASTGYGLAGRISAAFGHGAATVGVFFERPGSGARTATAGWYNNLAFEKLAVQEGLPQKSINGDAFSDEVKAQTIDAVREIMPEGKVDLVLYSLAAPKRKDPATGTVYSSAIKPIGSAFSGRSLDFHTGELTSAQIEPATPEEVDGTIAVMGGADWLLWMQALKDAGALAQGCATVAFSYIGPSFTHAIYKDGTIGRAKEDLEEKGRCIDGLLAGIGGKAFVSVNKALVTQASAAIPVVPLYITLLFRLMKEKGTHEDCTMQMVRLLARMYPNGIPSSWDGVPVDEAGRIRMDDWEMDDAVQAEIARRWDSVNAENLQEIADLDGYRQDFFSLFGFGVQGVDYGADVEI